MAKVESTVTIARSVEEVFRFFLGLDTNARKTDPDVESIMKTPEGPTRPGTTFHFRQKALGKIRETTTTFTPTLSTRSWNPSGASATKGLCPGRHRTSAASDRREERISSPREWKGPRGVEHHLVHRIRTQLQLDRSLAADPHWWPSDS